jgi:ribonuclease P protein component
MLSKKYRLTKRKQFNYIYRRGRSFSGRAVSLVFSFCKMKNIKIGFSASKKIGGSVVRHRTLRLMREAVKPLIPGITENHNYIFVAREGITKNTMLEIRNNIMEILLRAGQLSIKK